MEPQGPGAARLTWRVTGSTWDVLPWELACPQLGGGGLAGRDAQQQWPALLGDGEGACCHH